MWPQRPESADKWAQSVATVISMLKEYSKHNNNNSNESGRPVLPPLRDLIAVSSSTPRSLPPLLKLPKSLDAQDTTTNLELACRKTPTSSFDLQQIQLALLKENPEPGYVHVWNKKIGRGARYKKKIHVKTCHICGKEFSRPSTLKTHIVVHSEERPFKCSYPGCKKSYNVKSNLRRHEKKHCVKHDHSNGSHSDDNNDETCSGTD